VSKIQEALKKLQGQGGESTDTQSLFRSRIRTPEAVIPIARRKKVDFEGEKLHLDQQELIRGGLLAPLDRAIPVAEEFRRIKRPIIDNAVRRIEGQDEHMNLVMVASPLPGAGKTFCSLNLAASISLERDLNVLLVDADVAKPHLSTAFGLRDSPGLLDILADETRSVEEVLIRTDLNDIQVLPAGVEHTQSTELLASDRMELVMQELARRYSDRVIILDSPPLLISSEAPALARQTGQILMIVESGKTTHEQIQGALEVLDRDKAINLILNKSTYSQTGGYYGGYYGYSGFSTKN
jgi:receptor protein-tyrosine kinase